MKAQSIVRSYRLLYWKNTISVRIIFKEQYSISFKALNGTLAFHAAQKSPKTELMEVKKLEKTPTLVTYFHTKEYFK